MRKISMFSGILLVALGGCSQPGNLRGPSDAELARADVGAYPPDYKSLVRSWSEHNLSESATLQFGRVSKPRREWGLAGSKKVYGWSVCAMISAPNAYGEYTGPQTFWFLIHGDRIVDTRQSYTITPGHYVNCSDGDAPIAS
jgi:hypothetical protein